ARLVVAADERPEADRNRGEQVDQPVRDQADEDEDAFGDRDPERDLDSVLAEGDACARHYIEATTQARPRACGRGHRGTSRPAPPAPRRRTALRRRGRP